MKLVIPISHIDLWMAPRLLLLVPPEAPVLLVITQRAWWDADQVIAQAKAKFKQLEVYRLPDENEDGWPESCTHLFYSAMKHLAETGNTEPVYFFELDNTPIVRGWFELLKEEYARAGKPYMGVIGKTVYQNRLTGRKWKKGRHMVGTGIYPADFFTRCKSVHYITHTPWDIAIEKEVVPECHHTELIAHRWGTVNYRRDNGVIVMDDEKPGFDYAAPIPEGTAVVHGNKDGSLYKLLDPSLLSS